MGSETCDCGSERCGSIDAPEECAAVPLCSCGKRRAALAGQCRECATKSRGVDKIRFLADSRHGDWSKGQMATVIKELVTPPQNQSTILVVELADGTQVWATSKDIEPFNQLSLF